MTTTLDARREAVADHERRATRAVTRYAVGGTWYIGIWYFVVSVVAAVVVITIEVRNGGVGINPAAGPAGSARFFLFVMAILLPLMITPVHLAAGGTRRTLTRGFLRGGAAVGLMFAAVSTLLVVVQPVVLGWLDVPVVGDPFPILTYLGTQVALCIVYVFTGNAIAISYYRFGGWVGTAVLLLLLLPPALAEYATTVGLVTGLPLPSPAVVVVGCAVALAASATALWFMFRDLQVRPRVG
ncbi:hypothetical protein SAMN04489860_0866 [Paraoerskovia marina]|uniref:ABC-2 family transporter protein n=1 Tax=Paraoerskovia marina TaxID=545619 RepID=A0A1H1PPI0_9CELL|nr:hypothetical protein [Paraoerskovia marina]SDS13014.1 hypothetical protein SAMN04489860_0866 [Paraoerskovia marina]